MAAMENRKSQVALHLQKIPIVFTLVAGQRLKHAWKNGIYDFDIVSAQSDQYSDNDRDM